MWAGTIEAWVIFEKVGTIFLYETLVHTNKVEELCYVLDFDFCFSLDRKGRGVGLTLLWRNSINLTIINYLRISLMVNSILIH